jgi:hypothetical protein
MAHVARGRCHRHLHERSRRCLHGRVDVWHLWRHWPWWHPVSARRRQRRAPSTLLAQVDPATRCSPAAAMPRAITCSSPAMPPGMPGNRWPRCPHGDQRSKQDWMLHRGDSSHVEPNVRSAHTLPSLLRSALLRRYSNRKLGTAGGAGMPRRYLLPMNSRVFSGCQDAIGQPPAFLPRPRRRSRPGSDGSSRPAVDLGEGMFRTLGGSQRP